MKVLVFVLAAVALCGAAPREGPQCTAPNGGGLSPVLGEFVEMIPLDQVLEVLLTAITSDPETQSVMEYISSEEFHSFLVQVRDAPAFRTVLSFACNDLYFDAQYYLNVALGFLGFPELSRNSSRSTRVFNTVLEDLLALLPIEKMKALLEEKLATDYYVQLAFQKINSDEFGTIIEALQGNAAWNDMKSRLVGFGVDVDHIISTVGKLFRP